jgi:hypothetical protein
VHHRIDVVLGEDALEQVGIARVADDEFARGHGRFEACRQVIEGEHVFARGAELADDVAADISGPTGNKYLFVFHSVFRKVPDSLPEM